MWSQNSFCSNSSECHITVAWRYQSYLLIVKGRIIDTSPPAHLHLHVLLCLGSCCQDVIYFGISHERYERALTRLVTQPIARFYCKRLPGKYSVWCMHKKCVLCSAVCVTHRVSVYVSLCASKRYKPPNI